MPASDIDSTWGEVARTRRDLADALTGIDPARWDEPSWCDEWRVRDVVGHVLGNAEGAFVLRRALPGLLRHRLQVDAFLSSDARQRGSMAPAELLDRLRDAAGGRFLPPGRKPADVLADVLVHTQDALRPLGIHRSASPNALRIALARTAPQKAPPAKGRARGLRLRATDLDWEWGTGPEVSGTAEDLLLAICGRAAVRADLSGPGLEVLAGG